MRETDAAAMKRRRAGRRLINRLTPRPQLHLFDDRSQDAALAPAELKDGLNKLCSPVRGRAERKA
jgi:hypothetical protein